VPRTVTHVRLSPDAIGLHGPVRWPANTNDIPVRVAADIDESVGEPE